MLHDMASMGHFFLPVLICSSGYPCGLYCPIFLFGSAAACVCVSVLHTQIALSEETIQDMVQASDLLLMTDLKSLCCQFLESCITAENCIGIRLFSLHYCLYHVHYAATEFLQTHFGDVALTEEFRELPPDRLCELLAMEKLNIGNEKHVLEAVVRWLAHDPEDRKVGDAHFRLCEDKRGYEKCRLATFLLN